MHARRRRRIPWGPMAVVLLALTLAGIAAIGLNLFGVGDRAGNLARRIELIIDPPPDRPIDEAVLVTPRPAATAAASVTPAPAVSRAPGQTPPPAPTSTPVPPRVAVDVDLLANPADAFISEADKEQCAVAGTQMVLAMHDKAPLTNAFQEELAGRIGEWESRRDSRNGGWGPSAMVKALEAYGVAGYEVRAYETRQDALVDAARSIETYRAPVILLTWRGAHTWVMTGFTANADPVAFDDAKVTGTYILDPWYPRVSSIWGPSDPPGGYQDLAEMRRNYLPWKRPEGSYPKRDGLFLAVVPTESLDR
jgi:hypothetical protein